MTACYIRGLIVEVLLPASMSVAVEAGLAYTQGSWTYNLLSQTKYYDHIEDDLKTSEELFTVNANNVWNVLGVREYSVVSTHHMIYWFEDLKDS